MFMRVSKQFCAWSFCISQRRDDLVKTKTMLKILRLWYCHCLVKSRFAIRVLIAVIKAKEEGSVQGLKGSKFNELKEVNF